MLLPLSVTTIGVDAPGLRDATPPAYAGVTSGDARLPDIAMNEDGDAVAVWVRDVDGINRIEARYRPAGGAWGQVKLLSGAPGFNQPHVTIDAAGNAAAIWYHPIDGVGRAQTARCSSAQCFAGTWSSIKTLSPEGQNASESDIVADAEGNITAVWTRSDGTHKRVQTSTRPKGGSWSPVETLSPEGAAAHFPVVATSPGGVTMVVWQGGGVGAAAVRRPVGGNWGPVVPVTAPGASADFVDLAMDARARATVVWRAPVDNVTAMLARRRTSQGWGPIEVLSPPGSQASAPGNVAMSAGGDTYVVWAGVNNVHNRAMARMRPASGSWGPIVKLGAVGQTSDTVRVAVNARGDAVAAWTRFFGDSWIEASYKPVGQDWGLAREISEPNHSVGGPVVALGNDRTAISIFSSFETSIFRLKTVTRSPGGGWSSPVFLSPLP